jgi:hypothetical protein
VQPSREAIEWGIRQAAQSPTWTAEKWRTVGVIFGAELATTTAATDTDDQTDQNGGTMREAA